MKKGKSFSSRKSSGGGRGRSGGAKKTYGKRTDDRTFSSSRGASKPYSKRDDRDEKPYGDRPKPFQRSDERKDFKKPYEKKFSGGRSKPFGKRDDRGEKPFGDRSKPFQHSDERRDFKKPYEKKFSGGRAKPFVKRDDRDEKTYGDRSKSFQRSDERRDFKKPINKNFSDGRAKPFRKRDDGVVKPVVRSEIFRPSDDGKDFVKHDERPKRRRSDEKKSYTERTPRFNDSRSASKGRADFKERKPFARGREESSSGKPEPKWNRKSGHEFYGDNKPKRTFDKKPRTESYKTNDDGSIRLNKYISNSGICSRREADELIAAGVVSVNGEIMTELGYKVKSGDEVKYNNETLRTEKLVYILVNKPKDFITTVDDPQDRKTVMWLIRDACRERVYPVGRLDRNTTGVLLFTNDGELAKKLTHPSFEIQKIYQVELDAPLKSSDMEEIKSGVNLEDGFIKVDDVAYSSVGQDKSVVGVEIHSGRNRIVRRLFEHFGYTVKKLDRVYFAGLSKKDLPRGRWRFLTPLEVSNLKMMTGNKKMQKYFEA